MERFGKIELSFPRFEPQTLRFLTFFSPALGGRGDVTFFIPPHSEGLRNLPLVVLLHGLNCSHWAWALKCGVHLTAAEMMAAGEIPPMVLAMPSDGLWAEGTGYLHHETADYEAWIVEDVIDCARGVIDQLGDETAVFISGLSMGGYGALRLGGKYPQRFAGISAHSSVTHGAALQGLLSRPLPVTGDDPAELDAIYWLRKHAHRLPPLRFDCGVEDAWLADNRLLHEQLRAGAINHQYQEFPGGHDWDYWSLHVRDSLAFFGKTAGS